MARCDESGTAANGGRVVAAIPEHTVRSLPRSPPFAMQRGNRIHQRQSFLRVVPVCAGQALSQRYAPRVAKSDGACSRAWLDRWNSDRSGRPPYTARMQQLSRTARDQSIWSLRASQSRSAKWIRFHTLACCQYLADGKWNAVELRIAENGESQTALHRLSPTGNAITSTSNISISWQECLAGASPFHHFTTGA